MTRMEKAMNTLLLSFALGFLITFPTSLESFPDEDLGRWEVYNLSSLPVYDDLCDPLTIGNQTMASRQFIYGHLIPHSHDDAGWLKTVDQYFAGQCGRRFKMGSDGCFVLSRE